MSLENITPDKRLLLDQLHAHSLHLWDMNYKSAGLLEVYKYKLSRSQLAHPIIEYRQEAAIVPAGDILAISALSTMLFFREPLHFPSVDKQASRDPVPTRGITFVPSCRSCF
jgi:hypothetical protein